MYISINILTQVKNKSNPKGEVEIKIKENINLVRSTIYFLTPIKLLLTSIITPSHHPPPLFFEEEEI